MRIITLIILSFFLTAAAGKSETGAGPARNAAVSALQNDSPVGKKFTDVREADVNGEVHALSEYAGKGKWVLVDFWASWCGPCKREMPNVVAAYKKYHDKGFEVVAYSFDRSKDDWAKAIQAWDMPWVHFLQTKVGDIYGVRSIPDNLLIDPDGVIVARGLRGEQLEERLSEIFK